MPFEERPEEQGGDEGQTGGDDGQTGGDEGGQESPQEAG
jgi:hypothetical protein